MIAQPFSRAKRHNHLRRTREDRIVDAFVYLICIIVFLATFYPFYLAIVLAFNEGKDATYGGIYLWPRKPTLENFSKMFSDPQWAHSLLVSVARTVVGTCLTVFMTTFVSYGLSYKHLAGRKVYMGLLVFAMYFSGGVIPYYMVLRELHLLNTFWVYVIPGMLNLFYVLVAISFFQDLPPELAESARLDGASEVKIFTGIVLPISKPLLATIAIFMAVGQWNSWYDTAFYTRDKDLRTMAYQLMSVINKSSLGQNSNMDAYAASLATENVTNMSVQLAAMIVAVAPILVVYPFFQRYFVTGMTIGAVKG